jgi:hypothetical protein
VELVIAAAVSHKLRWGEMLWLRVIGASGSGKTELLRALDVQQPFTEPLEHLTAGAIRRGWIDPKDKDPRTLLKRLDSKLAVTMETAPLLTMERDKMEEIFGLLRGVYDGTLDSDYGSAQGHLRQTTFFDWILGTTSLIEKVRSLEYWLGSRFIDLQWTSPNDIETTVNKAMANVAGGKLEVIREKLSRAMADILKSVPTNISPISPKDFPYLAEMGDIASTLRSPVERDRVNRQIEDLPEREVATRFGQNLIRIGTGLTMLGVTKAEIKPYFGRLVFNSMKRIRASVIKAWQGGLTNQDEIASHIRVSQGAVSRVIEDIKVLGWKDKWLDILDGGVR